MTDEIMAVVFIVIAIAIVVRTVFYGIQVISEAKTNKRSLKIVNKIMKKYEPIMDCCLKAMDDLYDND